MQMQQDVPDGYKLTEVGAIPEDWEVLPIFDIVSLPSGQVDPRVAPYNVMILVAPDHIERETGRLISRVTAEEQGAISGKFLFRPGDIIYSKIRPYLRKLVLVDFSGLCSADMYPLTAKKDMSAAFIFYVMLGYRFSIFAENVSVRSGIPKINRAELSEFSIALPKIEEQMTIAHTLLDIDAFITSLEKLIAKKRAIKTATMQQLLTGKKRLPPFDKSHTGYKQTELGEIPVDWEAGVLGDYLESCTSGATPYRGRSEFYKGNIRWISSGELNYNVIYDTDEKVSKEAVKKTNLKIHPVGTFLMAITGLEAAGTRGSCGLVGAPSATNQSCMALYPNNKLSSAFLFHYYVFNGDDLALKYCQGTKQQSYTAKIVRVLPIILPATVDEQDVIAKALSDLDSEIVSLESRLAKTQLLKKGMMQELLTGKTRLITGAA